MASPASGTRPAPNPGPTTITSQPPLRRDALHPLPGADTAAAPASRDHPRRVTLFPA